MNFHAGPLFRPLSSDHLQGLFKCFSWGLGYVIPLVGIIGLFFVKFKWNKKLFLLAPVVIFQVFYTLFFNPLLGIEKDKDLYFMPYITIAFSVGIILDNIQWEKLKKKIRK
jgi:hypothetical protein